MASQTRTAFDWGGTELVRDAAAEVPALKKRFAREVQVHGSGALAQTLIRHDLIDEYRLLVFPALIGTGKRLFASGHRPGGHDARALGHHARGRGSQRLPARGGAQDRVVRAAGEIGRRRERVPDLRHDSSNPPCPPLPKGGLGTA